MVLLCCVYVAKVKMVLWSMVPLWCLMVPATGLVYIAIRGRTVQMSASVSKPDSRCLKPSPWKNLASADFKKIISAKFRRILSKKAYDTQYSQPVTHVSTN